MENTELTRTQIHENAMICIFQYLFYISRAELTEKKSINEIISDVMEVPFDDCDSFFKALIFETIQDRDEFIDIISQNLSKKWTFERLNLTDQAILLLFTSELLNKRVATQVAINNAVELAKKYCDENSYKYINAVLDKVGKEYA